MTDTRGDTALDAGPELTEDYRRGWCEGASAVLRGLMTRDSGGFLSGVKDKDGVPEEWLSVGFIMEVVGDVQGKPEPPRASRCQPPDRAAVGAHHVTETVR